MTNEIATIIIRVIISAGFFVFGLVLGEELIKRKRK